MGWYEDPFGVFGGEALLGPVAAASVGHDQVGASSEAFLQATTYVQKITVVTPGVLDSIAAYVQQGSDNVFGMTAGVWSDVAGAPGDLLAFQNIAGASTFHYDFTLEEGAAGPWNARWLAGSVGIYLPAGDYWIGVMRDSNVGTFSIFFDAGGSDRRWTWGAAELAFNDAGRYAITNTGKTYSIRGTMLRTN